MYQYPSWHFPPMNYKASRNSASRFYKKRVVLTKPPPPPKKTPELVINSPMVSKS